MSTENSEADEPLRAVAYVRMSTDRQIYSTENQMDLIAAYAARKNIAIGGVVVDNKDSTRVHRHPECIACVQRLEGAKDIRNDA